MNDMRAVIRETGGRETEIGLTLGERACAGAYGALLEEEGGVYSLTLTGDGSAPLAEARLHLPLPEGFDGGDVRLYADGFITNELRKACPLEGNMHQTSRTYLALKNMDTGAEFALGFVTAHRFYGWMRTEGKEAVFTFDMENKPLHPGEAYRMERFILSRPGEGTERFLERWGDEVERVNRARPSKRIPVGFCSWSRYYGDVDEVKLRRALEGVSSALEGRGANLFQIDAGWSVGPDSFPGDYVENRERFPSGLFDMSRRVREKGMDFGLWASPLVVSPASPYWEALSGLLKTSARTYSEDGLDMYPLDLDREEALAHLSRLMARLRREYGADYFKLDFLVCAFMSIPDGFRRVYFENDYCVAMYRKALMALRRGAGEDAALVACGAPLLESVGIMDAARVASDIVILWGPKEDAPSYWDLIKDVSATVAHRWPYQNKAFLGDPDGLVIRDWDAGDEFDPTFAEAKYWATQVAMSGGPVLVNEDVGDMSPQRKALLTKLSPPLGLPARPLDFFEGPFPTRLVIRVSDGLCFAAVYNLADTRKAISFRTEEFGFERALVLRCWDEKALGIVSRVENLAQKGGSLRLCPPHSAEVYMLRSVPEEPCFLYADVNLFGGAGLVDARLVGGRWTVEEDESVRSLHSRIYAWVPEGCDAPGETAQTAPGGRVVRIR